LLQVLQLCHAKRNNHVKPTHSKQQIWTTTTVQVYIAETNINNLKYKTMAKELSLSLMERITTKYLLKSVLECMLCNEDYGEYTDDGRFILSLDEA
jgi:hypothetical protein